MKFLKCVEGKRSGRRVAIIGGGVSGLAAAGELACNHEVHVFDEMPELGGFLRFGISSYFVAKEGLEERIKELEEAGVVFHKKSKIDDDTFEEIVKEYDAVLIATGSWRSKKAEIEGMELEGVYYADELIKAYNLYEMGLGKAPELRGKLAVVITEVTGRGRIGGDLLLVDLAPMVLEKSEDIGVEKIIATYKGNRKETRFAEQNFDYLENYYFEYSPEKFVLIEHLEVTRLLGDNRVEEFEAYKTVEENGKLVRGEKVKAKIDNVIIASSLIPTPPFSGNHGIELNKDGTIWTDSSFKTTREKVFACGNVKHGPWFLMPAFRSGKSAARSIDNYLKTGKWEISLPPKREELMYF